MKIKYTSPYVPAEWIAAFGFKPSRLYPESSGGHHGLETLPGQCPYARMIADECLRETGAAGIVIVSTCDQCRRMAELVIAGSSVPVFLFHMPATWQTPVSFQLYCYELKRLGNFLVRCGGTKPSDAELIHLMNAYESARVVLRGLRSHISARQNANLMTEWHENNVMPLDTVPGEPGKQGLPVALLGGPLLKKDFSLFDCIEKQGGSVVLDGSETGERLCPLPYDPAAMQADPFREMAQKHFDMPDVFRRPNKRFYEWFETCIAERGVRGVLLVRRLWCDIWHAEADRLKERTGVPVLEIELSEEPFETDERLLTRLQAFMETICATKWTGITPPLQG